MALVITLSFIVLVTITSLAFFVQATSNRTIEASRTSQVLGDQVAASGVDYAISQFLREMTENALSSTSNNITLYQVTNAAGLLPQKMVASANLANANLVNLIRQSVPAADSMASAVSSSTTSKNGRAVAAARWNAPQLHFGTGFSTNSQTPNWIYLQPDGTASATAQANTIGRFAYNAYDISGLLDINVAGSPSSLNLIERAKIAGTLVRADLSAIPGINSITNANSFLSWRNPNTSGSFADDAAARARTGFLTTSPGDRRITSRQDLIKLVGLGILPAALPYLTTFSRAVNAPSWTPLLNASEMGTNFVAGLATQPRNYRANANVPASINRNLPNVRVITAFTRRDGSQAKAGDPLITQRFPLNKLALVVNGAADPDILKYFGLTWGTAGWNYRAPTIMTLAQVASAGREPDFFELLKAGILDGSLGKSTAADTGVQNSAIDRNLDLQVFSIGANLIDQADTNDLPTVIQRGVIVAETVYGLENHPYIYMMSQTHFRRRDMDYDPANINNPQPWLTAYQQMQVWNPNLNAAASGRTYRIRALRGETRVTVNPGNLLGPALTSTNAVSQVDRFVVFTGTSSYNEPTMLNADRIPAGAGGCNPENRVPGTKVIGFHFGNVLATNSIGTNATGTPAAKNFRDNNYVSCFVRYDEAVIYQLEIVDGLNVIPLQRINTISAGMGQGMPFWEGLWPLTELIYGASQKQDMFLVWCKTDPRVQRFGIYGAFYPDQLNDSTMGRTRPARNLNAWANGPASNSNPGWKVNYPLRDTWHTMEGYTPDDLNFNRQTGETFIADPDGVVRPADGTYASNISALGSQARPVMLNRPFTSVGEMGYALRGDPWKSLDFASANSADAALLDLFSVSDAPAIQAGVVNLNVASPEVLSALLVNSEIDPGILPSTSLTPANATSLGAALSAQLKTAPLFNRADLARKVEDLGSTLTPIHKRQKEVLVRALADVSNTRTWNLFIDVVAQSGSFPPGPTGPGDFVVQGEQRRWVQVAADRITGKIIDQFTEISPE